MQATTLAEVAVIHPMGIGMGVGSVVDMVGGIKCITRGLVLVLQRNLIGSYRRGVAMSSTVIPGILSKALLTAGVH